MSEPRAVPTALAAASTARPVFAIVKEKAAGCGAACGSAAATAMPADLWARVQDHPCYSEEAHHHFARMHVAVAPACNIQCHYCNRKFDCANESRPGVVSEKLTPEQAARKVLAVAARLPQLSVVGIAGPGDALANPARTFRTFELIRAAAPDLKLCLSTNGLALLDHVDAIRRYDIDHVTVTINMVDPEIGERIYPWVFYQHRRWKGREASRILSERQLAGLEALTAAGVLVKVNSVLIPGVNDRHLAEVNRAVKERGAFLHNIMPLLSDPAHGTHYGLTGQRGPSATELAALQEACGGGTQLMRHCRQCRADAVGMLGEDLSTEFALDRLGEVPAYDNEARLAYRDYVERERANQREARQAELVRLRRLPDNIKVQLAVATKSGGRVNQHFGHAREFQIYEASAAGVRYLGQRKLPAYCQGGYDDEEAMPAILEALAGCSAVLVAKIGRCPRQQLERAGIEAVADYAHESIEVAALKHFERHALRQLAASAVAAA